MAVFRRNSESTLLASAARTAETSSPDQNNYAAKGAIFFLRVSAITDTPSITLRVYTKDSISGQYGLLVEFGAVTAEGNYVYILYPGAVETAATANLEIQGLPLPRTWKALITHADADSITYSVSCAVIV